MTNAEFFMLQLGVDNKPQATDKDEVTADYTIENGGRTHILVLDFPEGVDEEVFLISLKAYMRAQSDNLKAIYAGKKGH